MYGKKGFSLVELLVVVAIIGILSVILVPNVRVQLEKAKVAKTKALISQLENSLTIYFNDFGKYPESYNPQKLYIALAQEAKTPLELDSSDTRLFRQGENYWIKPENESDTRRSDLLGVAGVPPQAMVAQLEENVIIDAWENPIYYVSSDVYNPGRKTDFRRRSTFQDDAPCAYEIRENKRFAPYNPRTFQLISFGPDQTTISPSTANGGIGSMIDTDKRDNDDDGYFDKEDTVREGDPSSNSKDVIAEDDITNF